jgi:translation initiation factor IF-3
VPKVRLVDDAGEQLGVKTIEEALALAQERGLDLAEVAPNVDPPVCKIIDYGKYQYHQKKVEQKHKKMQKQTEVKGVRIGFRTGEHDLEVKSKLARRFLADRHAVKITLVFRGREAQHSDLAKQKMLQMAEGLSDVASVETAPKMQGNTLFMLLNPLK